MSKIPVKDLAQKMGMAEQDLLFKLRSIGVRLDGEDSLIDADIIKAIMQGKRLPQPREVILRDDSTEEAAVEAVRQPTRLAAAAMKPPRRSLVQRVDSRIRTLDRPLSEITAAAAPPAASAAPTKSTAAVPTAAEAAQAAAAVAPTVAAATTAQPATTEPATAKPATKETPTPSATAPASPAAPAAQAPEALKPPRSKIRARLIERGTGAPVSPPASTRPGPSRVRPGPRPAGPPGRPPRGRHRARGRGGRRYDGPQRRFTPSEPVAPLEPVSERGKRRAKKREELGPQTGQIQFREDRPGGAVTLTEGMTVRDFSDKLGIKTKDLIKILMGRGMLVTINHVLDVATASEVAEELGVETMEVSFEEEVQLQHEETAEQSEAPKEPRAPVITVMGHVDHGKTTLLDTIRSTRVAAGEAGGITQHIGAYEVRTKSGGRLVFLDTPGHEAFSLMRARGAKITDLVVLVVGADDGVMPQTLEAIDHSRAANVPLIVAINKIDRDNANPDRVKKELSDKGLLVEDWGGDIVAVPISALKGDGVPELLEMIHLNADMLELKASPSLPAQGAVLESRKEVGRGIVATVLVQDGTLRIGDAFVTGATWGRVRSMTDQDGKRIDSAPPATPVEVTGFNELPAAGDAMQAVADESKARSIADFRRREERQRELAPQPGRMSLDQLFDQIELGETKELLVVVKADVHGSLEVLRDTLEKLSTEKVQVRMIHGGVGAVTTNDVVLASASTAIIVGFNVRPERNAKMLAGKEQVDIRLHTVIYELADEIRNAMTGLLEPTFEEVQQGTAEVRETFKVPKIGVIAGCHVIDGTVVRNSLARVLRDNRVVYEGKITSLRRFKDDASEVRNGFECGIGLDHFQDLKPGDLIEGYMRKEVAGVL